MKNQLLPSPGSQRVDAAVKTQLKMTAFLLFRISLQFVVFARRVFLRGLENCEQKLSQSLKRCFRKWSLYSRIHQGRASFHIQIIERQISHISRIIPVITSKLSACADWEPLSTILLHGTTSFAVPWQNEIWNIMLVRSTGFERTLLMLRFSCLIFVRCCSFLLVLMRVLDWLSALFQFTYRVSMALKRVPVKLR